MKTIIEKLRKIKQLADNGIDGEKKTAKVLLEKLLAEHDLTLSDIEKEELIEYEFSTPDKMHVRIISQILYMHVKIPRLFGYKNKPKKSYSELTVLQYLQIKPMYEFYAAQYRRELRKQKETLLKAFIHKHNLFREQDENEQETPQKPMSHDELMDMLRAMNALETVQYRLQLS